MLFIGPLSREIVRAVHLVSDETGEQLGMCATEGQCGPDPYTGLTYEVMAELRERLMAEFPRARVLLLRDHMKPPFEVGRIDDLATWGFGAVHLHAGDQDVDAVLAMLRDRRMVWEVGPGEDDKTSTSELFQRLSEGDASCCVKWLSYPTGNRVAGLRNAGPIDEGRLVTMRSYGIALKAHNCDYADISGLQGTKRFAAANVAPQLGVAQTCWYLSRARAVGFDLTEWETRCIGDLRHALPKWPGTKSHQVTQAIGHYYYDSPDMCGLRERTRLECEAFMTSCVREMLCRWHGKCCGACKRS